jgi:hypothetical protein
VSARASAIKSFQENQEKVLHQITEKRVMIKVSIVL